MLAATLLSIPPLSIPLTLALLVAQPGGFEQPPSWTQPIEPFQIAGPLYYVGTADLTSYLFVTPAGHVLLDVPLEENAELVLSNIRKLGFDPRDVVIQLASHAHFDHVGGIATALRTTGATLSMSEHDAALMANGGKGDFFLGDGAAYPPAKAERILRDGERVRLGGLTLTAHLTPGHTRGCTTWSAEIETDGETLDVVSVCSLSVLSGYRLVGSEPSYPGIARDYCTSLETLRSLGPDVFLGSHGSFIRLLEKAERQRAGERRAFVDPDGYRRWVKLAGERIEATLREQGAAGGCAEVLGTSD
ncbi:MAG TPA: subclass B3 metallo-beta-lactamase [Thermoanaerobaculia bacterium]|nr:subclass B3 metallo-beta-lactamase [Thermoanaerobaculia bacterium]